MLKLNVGGKMFTTSKMTISSKCVPNYFSAYLDWKPATNFIFIDRDPKYFEIILNHIRGYTITLPHEECELIRLYEDANFYGITSLVAVLEDALGLKLKSTKRENTKAYIKEMIKTHNLRTFYPIVTCINQLSDKELIDTKTKIDTLIKTVEHNKQIQVMFEGLVNFIKLLENQNNIIAKDSHLKLDEHKKEIYYFFNKMIIEKDPNIGIHFFLFLNFILLNN